MHTLHDTYGRRTLDFIEALQSLDDYDAICRRIAAEVEWYGYTRLTVWALPGPGERPEDGVLFNSRPADYTEHYVRADYALKDPVLIALRCNTAPFTWNEVRSMRLSRTERRIIDEARDFDAHDGILVPITTASGETTLFSPCGRDPILSPRARTAIEMVGIYSHHALRRAKTVKARAKKGPPLTPREREVMLWVATGKSDDEIASILSIGRETVLTHVANAKRKLDATRRTYAVVQAIRLGEIML